jgi:hypothetical protein
MDWVLVGLGDYDHEVDVEIRWTNGDVQTLSGLSPDRYHDVRYGARTAQHLSPPPAAGRAYDP